MTDSLDPISAALVPPPDEQRAPVSSARNPLTRIRETLFRSPLDGAVSVVVLALLVYVVFRAARLVFKAPERWDIIRVNLRQFMVGRYPDDDLWRIVVVAFAGAFVLGLLAGANVRVRRAAGLPVPELSIPQRLADLVQRLWPMLLGAAALLSLTRTITPLLVIVGLLAVGVVGRIVGGAIPTNAAVWMIYGGTAAVALLVTIPSDAVRYPLVVIVAAIAVAGAVTHRPPPAPLVVLTVVVGLTFVVLRLFGDSVVGTLAALAVGAALAVLGLRSVRSVPTAPGTWIVVAAPVLALSAVGFLSSAAGWQSWGGLMLNLFLAVCGIALSFPLGIVLALGRRAGRPVGSPAGAAITAVVLAAPFVVIVFVRGFDLTDGFNLVLLALAAGLAAYGMRIGMHTSLPLIRAVSVGYIELIRGMPLYVLLLVGAAALNFFFPPGVRPPEQVARAIVVFTIFTAAYIAEIVRGGLQSLPKGQTEAAQALGLSPTKTTALIIMPQALRNVIPGIVGQFISLFKDTTLAAMAMGFLDLMTLRNPVQQQPAFRGGNYNAVTLAFIAFVFWVFCITMSRESQRLEKKLGVGTR